ncbi:hypothetical protein F5B19DRAFT_470197 [Rostrohypoxylon terebratum]|nr:hypothetical protein F5B19DRAFT_470197 [Rostrohypoxylon terebratum]
MSWQWNFDVSAFLVLLSEDEELGFRRASKRLVDVLSLAPVSGLQAYLRDYSTLIDVEERQYISPYGKKVAPLRNIRVAQMISRRCLLEDGTITFCEIKNTSSKAGTIPALCWLLTLFSWIVFAALVAASFLNDSVSWIGKSNLIAFALWSIFLRALDAISFVPAKVKPSFPDEHDAAIFLGRRNSAFVIEGSRQDVLRWTGTGLDYRRDLSRTWQTSLAYLHWIARIGTFILLTFVFCTIPNGTSEEQIIFIVYNVLGQLTTWTALRLHTKWTLSELQCVEKRNVPTRTHVYAELLRRYDQDDWSEAVGLLPNTPIWIEWKQRVIKEGIDPKELYDQCKRKN